MSFMGGGAIVFLLHLIFVFTGRLSQGASPCLLCFIFVGSSSGAFPLGVFVGVITPFLG